ncbi:unnamed protein product [Prorocentrum cordatum]|uniref:phosphatidyl-N-methylethanolamine N-methyltransferase n=1 Tax=Prorocentrum cordatum TaxID=2364126 RepID=A0ABN9RY05_9DINO|nr:unnamed protein product [Polarella glacialis]
MARVPRAVSARARGPPRDTSPPSPPFPGSRATRGRAEAAGAMFWLVALVLLGIERFLYGYIYHYPNSFKRLCRGPLKALLDYDEGVYWQVANHLGIVIKVFQFGVVAYDIMPPALNFARPVQLCVAAVLIGIGQLLNAAVFRAIGAMGVYYGTQLGYEVPWCSSFPYNAGIPDPQYWGVVFFLWGLYLGIVPSWNIFSAPYTVPWLETFWYIVSMKLLESTQNGQAAIKMLGLPADNKD